MLNISFPEIVVIFLVVLVIFGPDRIPELASKMGKLFGTFRKTSDKFRREFYNSVYEPAKEIEREVTAELEAISDPKILEEKLKNLGLEDLDKKTEELKEKDE